MSNMLYTRVFVLLSIDFHVKCESMRVLGVVAGMGVIAIVSPDTGRD